MYQEGRTYIRTRIPVTYLFDWNADKKHRWLQRSNSNSDNLTSRNTLVSHTTILV
jgi:hypothetical protein